MPGDGILEFNKYWEQKVADDAQRKPIGIGFKMDYPAWQTSTYIAPRATSTGSAVNENLFASARLGRTCKNSALPCN